jgi:RNA polymerase sigma-70 factor (ECF subfamily)
MWLCCGKHYPWPTVFTTPPSLLQRLRESPEQATWEKFVDMYTPLLVAWSRRLGLTEHDVADLVQDIFTILVEQLPRFRYDDQKSFRAWLKTVLQNRWRRLSQKRAAEMPAGSHIDELPNPGGWYELEEEEYRRYLVRRALELMQTDFEPATWRACWEFVVNDRPAADVAKQLGITVNAVYLAKGRVLRALREELAGLLD